MVQFARIVKEDNTKLFANYSGFFSSPSPPHFFFHSSSPWCSQCVSSGESSKTTQSVNSSRKKKKGISGERNTADSCKFLGLLFYWQMVEEHKKKKKKNCCKTLVLLSWTFEVLGKVNRTDQTHIHDRQSEMQN